MFINGSSTLGATATTAVTRASLTGVPFGIGNYHAAGGGFGASGAAWYVGYISNLRVIKGTALYTSSFTLSNNMLTAISGTSLLTLQYNGSNNNNMFVDKSSITAIVTRAGDTSQGTFSPYSGSYSVYFTGTGMYLSSPTNAGIALGTGDFTIEFWMYSFDVSNTTQKGPFQISATAGGLQTSYTSGVTLVQGVNGVTGVAGAFTVIIGATSLGSGATPVITTSTWYHIAITRQSGTARVFLNGALIISGTAADNLTGTYLVIGGYYSTAYIFNGYLSNFRLIKGAALYTSVFAIPIKPLAVTSQTTVLACNGPAVTMDSSINKMALTVTGTPSSSLLSPFSPSTLTQNQGNYSVFFSSSWVNTPASSIYNIGTRDFTIEFWFYTTSVGGQYCCYALLTATLCFRC
jgi:hypothetical protein